MNPFSFLSFFGGRGRDGLLLFSKRSKHNTNPILQKLSFPFFVSLFPLHLGTKRYDVDGQWLTFPFPFVHHQPLHIF